MRGIRERFAPDDGMTLVEVVIASAILFFIMTAILGLIGRTTLMSVQAKQMNSVTNAISSYVEWARSLPFADLDSLEATETALGGYTVSIVPNVQENENNENLKNLWMGVTVTAPNGFLRVVNTMVIIHDRDQYMTQAQQGPLTDPTVVFLAASPPDTTPVWLLNGASYWKDASGVNRPLTISARATATEGRTVEEVYFQLEATWDLEDILGNPARWEVPTWTDSPIFSVDLDQRDSDGNPIFREGLRSVFVYVRDSNGVIRHDMRTYLVDNRAPDIAPWPVELNDHGPTERMVTWPMVMDGTTPAYKYAVQLRRQPLEPVVNWGSWPQVFYTETRTTGSFFVGTPMSRYWSRAMAGSPRSLWTPPSAATYLVTRPTLTGTYSIVRRGSTPKGWDVTPTLTATAPTFESTETSYQWYADGVLIGTTIENTFPGPTVTVEGDPNSTPFPARTYTVVVTTKPLGSPSFSSNEPVSLRSNAVTTVAGATGTYTFTEGTW